MPVMHTNDRRESEFPMLRTVLHNLFPQIPAYFAQGFHVRLGRGNGQMTPRRRRQAHPAIEAVEARRMLSGITADSNNLNNIWTDGISIDPSAMPLTVSMSPNNCLLGTPTPPPPASGQPLNSVSNAGTSTAPSTDPNSTWVKTSLGIRGNSNNDLAPVILIAPVGYRATLGKTVTLSAEATISTSLRWIESHDQGTTWNFIADFVGEVSFFRSAIGGSSTDIKLTATLEMNNTMYAAVFSNNFGSTSTYSVLMQVVA